MTPSVSNLYAYVTKQQRLNLLGLIRDDALSCIRKLSFQCDQYERMSGMLVIADGIFFMAVF